jgi:hypothetical protein
MSSETEYGVYRYRWIILAVFMFVNLTIQTLWISYAPVTSSAARFYGVSDLESFYPAVHSGLVAH